MTELCEVDSLASYEEAWRAVRRRIHQHPELAFEETETAALVAARLRDWRYEVETGVGRTGVVATLRIGDGARSIGLRADMDALPMTEVSDSAWRSGIAGRMHACGHDGHTAMLLGAAEYLARERNFNGTLRLYFQPAEERGHAGGARAMLDDCLLDRFPCDMIFAMHTHPGLPVGTVVTRPGAFMSAFDRAIITVRGLAGHGARPHLAVDPVVIGSSIVMALQTLVSRNVDPAQPAVVTVGVFQAGTASNVIPATARLEVGIRSFDSAVRAALRSRLESLVAAQAHSYGASASIDYQEGCPVLVNAEAPTLLAARVARELLGDGRSSANADIVMASEDFAFLLQQVPGCMLRIGNGVDSPMVHHPAYDFDDRNLTVGAAFWARLVQSYLCESP